MPAPFSVPALHTLQDRLAALVGCTPEVRTSIVDGMLRRSPTESTSYWLQLVVAMGIATLGLALGSTAAVIGAMLVAPLMGPIVGLAMGLAIGSPFLVLRSAGRVGASVLVVVAGAAFITVLLPFHEFNAEISARTTPTALDLLIAAFCALAGAYAALRPGSDTTATAAGTSISISLVPPLCASGYGVGTQTSAVASGAALLFLTNLVAIVVVGTVAFLAVGFQHVAVRDLERNELARSGGAPVARSIARRLDALFGARSHPWLRLSMPLILLAVIYFPLGRALNEVAWEVRVRAAAHRAIATLVPQVVQSRVRIEHHRVEVAVVMLGTSKDAEGVRAQLEREIRAASEISPSVQVVAIPDATAFAGLESTLRAPAAPVATEPSPEDALNSARELAQGSVQKYFPVDASGPLLRVDLVATGAPIAIDLVHWGPPLPPPALEVLERSVATSMQSPVHVTASAIPKDPLRLEDNDYAFVAQLSTLLDNAASVHGVSVCATRPTQVRNKRLDATLSAMLSARSAVIEPGKDWSVRFVRGACTVADAGADAAEGGAAGADAAGSD